MLRSEGHRWGIQAGGILSQKEYFHLQALGRPHDQQASGPAALPKHHAQHEASSAATLVGQSTVSGLMYPEVHGSNHEWQAARTPDGGEAGSGLGSSAASTGESLELWAPFPVYPRRGLHMDPMVPALHPLPSRPGTPPAQAPCTPHLPSDSPGAPRDGSSRLGVTTIPSVLLVESCQQPGSQAVSSDHPSLESRPYSLAPDPLVPPAWAAFGDALIDLWRILLALPTKADLQAMLAEITTARSGVLGQTESKQSPSIFKRESAPQGPQVLPGLPTALTPSVQQRLVTRPPEQHIPYNQVSPQLCRQPTSVLYGSPSPESLATLLYNSTPSGLPDLYGTENIPAVLHRSPFRREGDGGLRGEFSAACCDFSPRVDTYCALLTTGALSGWFSRKVGGAVDTGNAILARSGITRGIVSFLLASTGSPMCALPDLIDVASWNRDFCQPALPKLREAGAIYRWGSLLLPLLGPVSDGLWELLSDSVSSASWGRPRLDLSLPWIL